MKVHGPTSASRQGGVGGNFEVLHGLIKAPVLRANMGNFRKPFNTYSELKDQGNNQSTIVVVAQN